MEPEDEFGELDELEFVELEFVELEGLEELEGLDDDEGMRAGFGELLLLLVLLFVLLLLFELLELGEREEFGDEASARRLIPPVAPHSSIFELEELAVLELLLLLVRGWPLLQLGFELLRD